MAYDDEEYFKKLLKMPVRKLSFAIFGNEYQAKKSASVQTLLSVLHGFGADIAIDRPFYLFLTKTLQLRVEDVKVFDGSDFSADFVISMGGDGTFLKAACRVGAKQTPIIGINTGRLGFLADISPRDIQTAIASIFADDYLVEAHTNLMIETSGEPLKAIPYALNDIAILKRDNASMISIHTKINGEHLVCYQADGLIVSTPTGSTAYSLSNGGPIMVPQTSIFCLTPVAPHSLSIRPIVISDASVITMTVESRSHSFLIAIDGRSEKLAEGTELTIRKAPYITRIVKRNGQKYFSTLREKMAWGVDQRQDAAQV